MADEEKPKQDEVKQEVTPVAPITPKIEKISSQISSEVEDDLPEFDDIEEGESFGHTMKRVLGAAGIRAGSVIGCSVVLIIVIGVGLFFSQGGWTKFSQYIPFLHQTEEKPVTHLQPSDVTGTDMALAYLYGTYPTPKGLYPSSMETAYKFGGILPIAFIIIPPQDSGLLLAYKFGYRGYSYDRIEVYIDNIRQIQNALNTDINAALNQSVDRRLALDRLLRDFDDLSARSVENAGLVVKEVLTLQSQTSPSKDRVNNIQKDFNANLSAFLPRETRKSLEDFVVASKEDVELRAQLGAFTKLDKYYQVANVKLAARIKDLKANQEALVKGVKVFDIKNSDLDIIKYEGTPPKDTIATPIGRDSSGGTNTYSPIDFATGIHN